MKVASHIFKPTGRTKNILILKYSNHKFLYFQYKMDNKKSAIHIPKSNNVTIPKNVKLLIWACNLVTYVFFWKK